MESYIGLLAEIRHTTLEAQAGLDAAAEAFRLADLAHGQSVQGVLNSAAARAAVRDQALAAVVRLAQDASQQLNALYGTLANALSQPSTEQNVEAIAGLRRDSVSFCGLRSSWVCVGSGCR